MNNLYIGNGSISIGDKEGRRNIFIGLHGTVLENRKVRGNKVHEKKI